MREITTLQKEATNLPPLQNNHFLPYTVKGSNSLMFSITLEQHLPLTVLVNIEDFSNKEEN